MNKLKAMSVFVSIVESGSMNAAADKLLMSQSSIVRTLAALEQELKVQLLARTTRKMHLTEEGKDYYQRCRHILQEVVDAETMLSQRQISPAGSLRITAPVTFGRLFLMPLLQSFLSEFNAVEAELMLLDRNVDLLEEGFDVALRIGKLPDSTLIAKPVGSIRKIICASTGYLQQHGVPKTPEDLGNYECIQLTASQNMPFWTLATEQQNYKIPIAGRFRTNHVETARDACCRGQGLGQFLSYQVEKQIADGQLIPVLEAFSIKSVPVNLVYPQSRQLSSRSRAFIDWVQPQLAASLDKPSTRD